jgi:hypothetical protein
MRLAPQLASCAKVLGMRGLEFIPTDDDDGDIFAFTMPERHDADLRQVLLDDEDWYYGDPYEDYLADDYWE